LELFSYLAQHEKEMKTLAGGLVITTSAGPGQFGYKHTFLENNLVDRVVHQTYSELGLILFHILSISMAVTRPIFRAPFFRIPIEQSARTSITI
jgi:aminopeptidase-like protein